MKALVKTLPVLVLTVLTFKVRADDKVALLSRLQSTSASTAIDSAALKPWHLKMEVQLYDDKGKPTEVGTVEEWWAKPGTTRITYTMPSYAVTVLHTDQGAWQTKDAPPKPLLLETMRQQVVHPMPIHFDEATIVPDLRTHKFGPVELECIMLDLPLNGLKHVPIGLFPTYCLDPGKDVLRIATEAGSPTYLRNRTGTFQGHMIATEVRAIEGATDSGLAHVTSLSTMAEKEMNMTPSPEMESIEMQPASLASGVIAGRILRKIAPAYPQAAKAMGVSGSVVLHALIGTDGHIHSLHILSTPDADLAIAAIAAVRGWLYQPYLLNGAPTEVDTTITVNFAMSR